MIIARIASMAREWSPNMWSLMGVFLHESHKNVYCLVVFEHEWIIFHFIYGMSSETHWRSPSFFKMGTLHHQAVSIQQTPGSGSKHDHRYCLLIFPGWELSIDSCWEGPSWDWYSKMGQREHGIAETPKTWWLYTLYRWYLMVDHLLTISLALP